MIKIRYLTESISDYKIFIEMHKKFSYLYEDGSECTRELVIKDYETFKTHAQNEEIFIAIYKEDVVGYLIAYGYEEKICEIKEIYIKPEFRKKGLGKKFVEKIKKVAQNEGFKKIQLNSATLATDRFWDYCNFNPLNDSTVYESDF